jgi:hypothetical protein
MTFGIYDALLSGEHWSHTCQNIGLLRLPIYLWRSSMRIEKRSTGAVLLLTLAGIKLCAQAYGTLNGTVTDLTATISTRSGLHWLNPAALLCRRRAPSARWVKASLLGPDIGTRIWVCSRISRSGKIFAAVPRRVVQCIQSHELHGQRHGIVLAKPGSEPDGCGLW